jgi:hypothetical protein
MRRTHALSAGGLSAKKKITIEFIFDDENFDLDAITYKFMLKTFEKSRSNR